MSAHPDDTGLGRVVRSRTHRPGAAAPGEAAPGEGDAVLLVFERLVDAPVHDVWEALTDPQRMTGWFGTWSGDPSSGSVDLQMAEAGGSSAPAQVLRCARPHDLAVVVPGPDGPWPLEVSLVQGEGGPATTALRFVHHLAEPHDASSIGPGWHYYLDRLGAVAAGRAVPEDWGAYYPRLAASYPVPPVA